MVTPYPLQRYSDYLDTLDAYVREHPDLSDDDYLDLLSPGEAVDLCVIRDQIGELRLSVNQHSERERLDALLIKHAHIVGDNLPPISDQHPRSHWWWHLGEGPQVHEEALAAAKGD